jgi:hypothetical protein
MDGALKILAIAPVCWCHGSKSPVVRLPFTLNNNFLISFMVSGADQRPVGFS